jgi:hypothetical protein
MSPMRVENVVRWTARAGSIATLLILSAFVFGDAERSGSGPTPVEWVGLAFFPVGIMAGLLIGWWRELPGGLVTAASLAGFYGWHFVVSGRISAGPWFVVLAAPGLLFLICGWRRRARLDARRNPPAATSVRARTTG